MAIVYQDAWKKLGLDAAVDAVDFPTLWGVRFHPGKFEAISFLWPSGFYPDPAVGLYPFLCANSCSGYCSQEMDRLIVAGRSTLDPPVASQDLRALAAQEPRCHRVTEPPFR